MRALLAYGQGHLEVELPENRVAVIEPRHCPGLPDEHRALIEALDHPVGSRPLRELARPGDRICVAFTDLTRATPNERLVPWLLGYLSHIPCEHITLLNQTGTHRPNTRAELEGMLTPEVVARYRVLNHEASNPEELLAVGTTRDGTVALLNRHLVEADLRIVLGFIEPHFFAGFSGGPKGIMPGCAGLQTVMRNHGADHIGHPCATFGVTEGNPLWEEIRDIALRAGDSFLVNVSLNADRQITGVFAGDIIAAHRVGCDSVRATAMQAVPQPFEIVITSNSGYPLDLNLYQGVKGMCAGARILKPGGTLILACECREGVPSGSPYESLLRTSRDPQHLLGRISTPGFTHPEQWQAQIQAIVQSRADVLVRSSLPDSVLRACHLEPCRDIAAVASARLRRLGPDARIGVLPQGPLTIPFLA